MMKEGEWGVIVGVMILDAYITSCSALSSVPSEVFGLLSIYHVLFFFADYFPLQVDEARASAKQMTGGAPRLLIYI